MLWARWLGVRNKNRAAGFIKRLAVAIVIAVPFIFVDFILMIIGSLGNAHPPRFNEASTPLTIVNNTSVPLTASVNLAYTPGELEGLRNQGIDIDLTENFVTYRDVVIPAKEEHYKNQHTYTIPIPRYREDVQWPYNFKIALTDSLGDREVWLRADDIDSTMRARMEIIVTDSMLQPRPIFMIEELPEPKPWQRKGGDR
ncbi:MAG: hypothetical protein LBV74_16155 [Tannerella sp.]|nr:hypothetical protein [Tannerella sp.]